MEATSEPSELATGEPAIARARRRARALHRCATRPIAGAAFSAHGVEVRDRCGRVARPNGAPLEPRVRSASFGDLEDCVKARSGLRVERALDRLGWRAAVLYGELAGAAFGAAERFERAPERIRVERSGAMKKIEQRIEPARHADGDDAATPEHDAMACAIALSDDQIAVPLGPSDRCEQIAEGAHREGGGSVHTKGVARRGALRLVFGERKRATGDGQRATGNGQ